MIRTVFKEASTGNKIAELMLPVALQKDDAVELPNNFLYLVNSTIWKITPEVTPQGVSIPTLIVRLR